MVLKIPSGLFGQSDVRETDLPQKTVSRFYAINPAAWTAYHPDVDDVSITTSQAGTSVNDIQFFCPINLPHGAVVTNVVVYGNAGASGESWILERMNKNSISDVDMAIANFNSADSSINSATIDNSNYTYGIRSTSLDTGDVIFGGIITYTIGVYEV